MEIFDTTSFMSRSSCGEWTPFYQWYYIASNLTIAISYLMIPIILWSQMRKRHLKGPLLWVNVLAGIFIIFCGLGHAIENVGSFWFPCYRFFAHWHFVTALASVGTMLAIPGLFSQVLKESR